MPWCSTDECCEVKAERNDEVFQPLTEFPSAKPEPSPVAQRLNESNVVVVRRIGDDDDVQEQVHSFVVHIKKEDPKDSVGVDVHHKEGRVLLVEKIGSGLIEKWNREQERVMNLDSVVRIGDVIVKVNDVSGNDRQMVKEVKSKMNLLLEVQRWMRK